MCAIALGYAISYATETIASSHIESAACASSVEVVRFSKQGNMKTKTRSISISKFH